MEILSGVSQKLSEDLFFYRRTDTHVSSREILDTLGPIWMLAWLDGSTGPLELFIDNHWVPLTDNQLLFMPPYSILKWKMGPGVIRWNAYVSYQNSKEDLFLSSVLLPGKISSELCSANDVLAFVKSKSPIYDRSNAISSDLGIRLKVKIESSYREELLIEELAQRFDVSRVSLFRHFKNQFGFSPSQYRQRLRLFETIRLVNLGESITRSVFDSGFSDLSEFSKQFRKVFYCSPSQFLRTGQRS